MATDRVLLPSNVKPTKYELTLQPDLATFKVAGNEHVHVKISEATNTIVVHSNEIAINAAHVTLGSVGAKKTIQAKSIDLDAKEERATFTFPESLPVGDAVLSIDFTATLNDGMAGFYRSKYYTPSGEERYMATTQFESTDARKAFPCWDEPAVKAIFEVTLIVPVDRVALSNMLPVNETVDGNLKTVKFAPSPIMSTYLLAFVVGEFEYVEDRTKEGVVVRVYTPVGKKNLGSFGLSVATKTLSYFTEYFDIPYPLPKLDMVAIADFSAGAMENWGLVTYREIALLIDEKSSVSQKQRVAYVVAHELAHQWFGNLVTMEWWSQLWLNEGFATFVGNLATDFIFPEWDMWTLFVNDYQSTAFSLDSLKSSHPIEVEVRTSAEISEIFDAISYNKGSCVIRMLETFLGHDNFRKGLQVYLKRHAYSNAVTEDLWKALSEISGQDVKQFMDAFTKAVNFPVVSVKQGSTAAKLDVSQTRFLASGESTESDTTAWHVALHIACGNSKDITKTTFSTKSATVDVDSKGEWIKVNSGQSGFYRVKYSDELLARLLPPLQSLALPPVDRLGVQGDVFALAKAGFASTSKALDIALALRNEVDYTVWSSLASNLASVASVWMHEPVYPQIQAFVVHLFEPIFAKLGWDAKAGESPSDTLLRSIVINRLGTNGHAAVIAEAKKRFQLSLTSPSSLSSDIKSTVYEIALLNGGQAEQDKLLELYKNATEAEDRVRILGVISLSRDEKLILKGLQFSLSDDVRDQDRFMVYAKVASVPDGGRVAWKFLQDNWQTYIQKLSKSGSALLSRIIARSSEHFTTEAKAKEVEAFFKDHSFPAGDRVIKQSIETVHARAGWLNRGRDDVVKWFGSHKF